MRSSGRVEESSLKLSGGLKVNFAKRPKAVSCQTAHILDLQLICKLN